MSFDLCRDCIGAACRFTLSMLLTAGRQADVISPLDSLSMSELIQQDHEYLRRAISGSMCVCVCATEQLRLCDPTTRLTLHSHCIPCVHLACACCKNSRTDRSLVDLCCLFIYKSLHVFIRGEEGGGAPTL